MTTVHTGKTDAILTDNQTVRSEQQTTVLGSVPCMAIFYMPKQCLSRECKLE